MANYYASSINGDDANDGLTQAAPKETLAAVSALAGAGDWVLLERGSSWEEGFPANITHNVGAYGVGARPFLDGTDAVTSWTLAAGARYTASVTLDETWGAANFPPLVFEDGEVLRRVASEAACESTPGSYFTTADFQTSPITVHLHATGAGNPASNGSEYRVSVRVSGVTGAIDVGNVIEDIHARGFAGNNGSLVAYGGAIRRCFVDGGTKHHMFADTFETVTAQNVIESTAIGASSFLVSFRSSGGAGRQSIIRDAILTDASPLVTGTAYAGGYTSHAGGVGYDAVIAQRVFARGLPGPLSFSGGLTVTTEDTLSVDCALPSWPASSRTGAVVTCRRHREKLRGAAVDPGGAIRATNGGTARIENVYIYGRYDSRNNLEILNNDSLRLIVRNLTIYVDRNGADSRKVWEHARSSDELTSVHYSVFLGRAVNGSQIRVNSGTYVGDYNVFYSRRADNVGDEVSLRLGATTYNTLAAWQAATGQDANSVTLTQAQAATFWLGDPSTGDYRINPEALVTAGDGTVYQGTFPDGTPITKAGAQPPLPPTFSEDVWHAPLHEGGAKLRVLPKHLKVRVGDWLAMPTNGDIDYTWTVRDADGEIVATGNTPTAKIKRPRKLSLRYTLEVATSNDTGAGETIEARGVLEGGSGGFATLGS